MTRDEALAHVKAKFDRLDARIAELKAENGGLQRIVAAQARAIAGMRDDVERIDRLQAIYDHGDVGSWSAALLALHHIDGGSLRAAIDAAVVPREGESA